MAVAADHGRGEDRSRAPPDQDGRGRRPSGQGDVGPRVVPRPGQAAARPQRHDRLDVVLADFTDVQDAPEASSREAAESAPGGAADATLSPRRQHR
jgi:hypothetical protein